MRVRRESTIIDYNAPFDQGVKPPSYAGYVFYPGYAKQTSTPRGGVFSLESNAFYANLAVAKVRY